MLWNKEITGLNSGYSNAEQPHRLLGQLCFFGCAACVKICALVSWKSLRINFLSVVLRVLKH